MATVAMYNVKRRTPHRVTNSDATFSFPSIVFPQKSQMALNLKITNKNLALVEPHPQRRTPVPLQVPER